MATGRVATPHYPGTVASAISTGSHTKPITGSAHGIRFDNDTAIFHAATFNPFDSSFDLAVAAAYSSAVNQDVTDGRMKSKVPVNAPVPST